MCYFLYCAKSISNKFPHVLAGTVRHQFARGTIAVLRINKYIVGCRQASKQPSRVLITSVSQQKEIVVVGATRGVSSRPGGPVSAAGTGDKHTLTCDRLISILIMRVMRRPHCD